MAAKGAGVKKGWCEAICTSRVMIHYPYLARRNKKATCPP
jgi:hypothetical protein